MLRTLESREADRQRYILPQRDQADVVIRWTSRKPLDLYMFGAPEPELALEIRALNSFDLTGLAEELAQVETLTVTHEPFLDARWQHLSLHGAVRPEALATIAREVIPNLEEITLDPSFTADLEGCLQLLMLVCLSSKLRWTGHREP